MVSATLDVRESLDQLILAFNSRLGTRASEPVSPGKMIGLVSVKRKQGSSSLALGLAWRLAELGQKVCLLDANLKQKGLTAAAGLSGHMGLGEALADPTTVADAIRPAGQPGIWILPAGNEVVPRTPVEFADVSLHFKKRFPLSLADFSSFDELGNQLGWLSMLDGVVLIAGGPAPSRRNILHVTTTLRRSGARVLGVVLNNFQSSDGWLYPFA